MSIIKIKKELRKVADLEKAKILASFFKTGKGQYGEGDKFLGIVVPKQRKISKIFLATNLGELKELLQSDFHEERLTALLILVERYKLSIGSSQENQKKRIFKFYIKNISRINNWDLVDLSAPSIVGDYLLNHFPKTQTQKFLSKLAKSKNIWARRVAIISTLIFIKQGRFDETLALSRQLLIRQKEKHDLIHKAVGWMLREMGKRDISVLQNFLRQFAPSLPRTTLRYSIERMDEVERKKWLESTAIDLKLKS